MRTVGGGEDLDGEIGRTLEEVGLFDTRESRPRDEGEVRAAHGIRIARQNEPDVAENRTKPLPCDNRVEDLLQSLPDLIVS